MMSLGTHLNIKLQPFYGGNAMSTPGRLVLLISLCGLNNQLQLHCRPESLLTDIEPIGYQVGSFAERYVSEELNISRSRPVPLDSPEEYALALERGPRNGGPIIQSNSRLP
ncbi:hypothetical protein V6N13_139175 [Hibiscus sabdariffa]|uniref:Uncharacterized protein n=1 Tax=Hibiscus sabdariffa TaxID=183260 RepID=A0ABR2PL23_9ROSI